MLPLALLPIAGILLGVGVSFSNTQTINYFQLQSTLGDGTFLNFIFTIMKRIGGIVFSNLPLLFAISTAIGIAKKEKTVAALSSVISFFVMHETISSLLKLNGKLTQGLLHEGSTSLICGIESLNIGIFGGIIVGLGVAYLHNKFYKIKLPDTLSFFSGIRFVPIISCLCSILLGMFMYFVWPNIQSVVYSLGGLVTASKYTGTLVYGIIERVLSPFGLNRVFCAPFLQTALGGAEIIDNRYVTGTQNIFFAELTSSNISKFSINIARFITGKFPFAIFGLPAAAFAIYQSAKPSNKKAVGGLMLLSAITSIITGITAPIEFAFLFFAPILYGIHCLFAGLSFMLMHLLKVTVGLTSFGGIIDLVLFGVLQGNGKTNWVYIIPVGVGYAVAYYFIFRFVIRKFKLITPGREGENSELKFSSQKDSDSILTENISGTILKGLGGIENITDIDCSEFGLIIKVKNEDIVDEAILKANGCVEVMKRSDSIQVTFAPKAAVIKNELEKYISSVSTKNI